MKAAESTMVTLRPVTSADEAFLYALYASTRAEEMALVPWNDQQRELFLRAQFAAQWCHYQEYYPTASHDVILLDEYPVGRLYLERTAEALNILDVTIAPEQRGRGLGTPLIRQLLEEATASERRVTIHIEPFNRARRLFERLGFAPVETGEVYWLFVWPTDQGVTQPDNQADSA